mgnify:FL=1
MASFAFSATRIGSSPTTHMALFEKFDHLKNDHSIFGKVNCQKWDLTVANVASKLPAAASLAPTVTTMIDTVDNERKLKAWTSIQQERWEGELEVEGEIPLWLASQTIFHLSCLFVYFRTNSALHPLNWII